jgi:hypothetical protein
MICPLCQKAMLNMGNYLMYCKICHLWRDFNNNWEKYSKDSIFEFQYYGFEEDLMRYLKLKAF